MKHKYIASKIVNKNLGDGKSVTDVASIAVEHEDGHVAGVLLVGPKIEGAKGLAVRSWDEQLFVISEAKLIRSRNVGSSIRWKRSGVNELTDHISGEQLSS